MSPRRGFTVIELTLAIGLGAMVVYVAVAGLRTASQSVTAANRLALENSILRAGVVIALEHTDFWTCHDDPTRPATERPLYATVPGPTPAPTLPLPDIGTLRGQPFTPFMATRDSTGYRPLAASSPAATVIERGRDEVAGGWNPDAWHAAEARGWSWGNLTERTPRWQGNPRNRWVPISSYKLFGHYEKLAAPDPAAGHHWQQRQLDGLLRSLGSYGMFDYVPANTGLQVYEKQQGGSENGLWKVAAEWCSPDGGGDYRLASDGNLSFTLDRLADTWGATFAVPNRVVPAADRGKVANRRYSTGIAIAASANNSSLSGIGQLLRDNEQDEAVLHDGDGTLGPNKPSHWPSLSVSNLRFIRTGAFISLNRISWVSPHSGQGIELSFTCFGTTLRGARQQRLRDGNGWADPFPLAGAPAPNLDTYDP